MSSNSVQDPKDVFAHSEIKEKVIGALILGTLIGGTVFITPNFPIILGMIMKLLEKDTEKPLPLFKVKRVLKQLEKREIVQLVREGDEVVVYVKNPFHPQVIKYSLKAILELKKKRKRFTGKWYLVIFDIPEQEKNKRDYLRKFLREIGFYQYQKSVYIFPYECEEEVTLIKKIVEGGKYVEYIVAARIGQESRIKTFFQLA